MAGTLKGVARTINARVRDFFDAPLAADAKPIELLQAALDHLEGKAQASGRGVRVFPYNRITVRVAQAGSDPATIEAVFSQLETRLRERLTEIHCQAPPVIAITVEVIPPEGGGDAVLRVECANDNAPLAPRPAPSSPLELRIDVLKGQCARTEYVFAGEGVAIGRGEEPADSFGRMRHNHVAFGETRDGVTETVARAHARLDFDPRSRAYVLFNESNSNPTFLVRGGRSLRVAPRDPRGVRVETGDVLQLGLAALRLTIQPVGSGSSGQSSGGI